MLRATAALLFFLVPGSALAQAAFCRIPAQPPRPRLDLPDARQPRRLLAIGGYTLALSWSPQYCATARGGDSAFQCGGRNGRFGFVLHGLWPDGVRGQWPQYCRAADLLPRQVVRQNLCATPSVQLMQHEWAKHGSCMTTRPELYFNLSRAFYEGLSYPDMTALARRKDLTVRDFTTAFARANKGLRADMMRVQATRGDSLAEVQLCMDRTMEYVRCPAGRRGANATARLRIEPGPTILPAAKRRPRAQRRPLILDVDPNASP